MNPDALSDLVLLAACAASAWRVAVVHADLARLQRRPRFRRYRAGVGGGATASADCTCPSSNTASASR